jgi:lipoprotein NlpD
MKKIWTRTAPFFLACVLLAGCSTPPPDEPYIVLGPDQILVRTGDTLYGLAEKHNVSLKQLMAANHLTSSHIRAGQILLIPQASTAREDSLEDAQDSVSKRPLAPLGGEADLSAGSAALLDPSLSHEIALERQRLGALETPSLVPPLKDGIAPVTPTLPDTKANLSPVPKAEIAKKTPFIWPVQGDIISPFKRSDTDGFIKIKAAVGTPVKASASGLVKVCKNNFPPLGKLVVVQGTDKDKALMIYANLETISVAEGASVSQGQTLGTVGKSPNTKESGLAFGIRTTAEGSGKKKICNPLLLLGGN